MKPANPMSEQTPLPVSPSSSPIPPQAGSSTAIQTSSQVSQKWPFAVGAMIAVAIVTGGLFLRSEVLKASARPNRVLNDTRSPLAEEQQKADALTTIKPLPTNVPTPQNPSSPPAAAGTDAFSALPSESAYPQEDLPAQPSTSAISGAISGSAFGHLSYGEDDPSRLTEVEPYRRGDYQRAEALDYEAAQAFTNMQVVARSQGIELMAISGYRSIASQKELFDSQIQRKGSEAAAAEYSAPPGHSEHHTGYAVDIADASQPQTDLKHSFENTPAYQWLLKNAYMYGFEQSFPKNNVQGVSFEPWHWRYISSEQAAKTFAAARTSFPTK